MEKKKEGLSRLLEIAGEKKSLLFVSELLSAISALCVLVPFWAIYEILKELLIHASDLSAVDSLPGTEKYGHHHWGASGVVAGMAVMAFILLLL